jgi:hypothetical protein
MCKHLILAFALGVIGLPGAACPAAADEWQSLIKDTNLREWQNAGGGDTFRAKEGTLTVSGPGQIIYAGPAKPLDLKNFELRAEVLLQPGARGGLAFHVPPGKPRSLKGVEIRLDNSYGIPGPGQSLQKTGSLVWLRPVVKSVVPDGRWFALQVVVRGRRVQVRVEKQLLVDYLEPEKLDMGPRLSHGTIAIRGHGEDGAVQIRKLQVRPLTAGKSTPAPAKLDETDLRLARLREQSFTLVDFHTHLPGGPKKLEEVMARSWKTGIGAGIVVPCGKGFKVADDKAALAFLKILQGRPVFVGMQAEGRDWVRSFSPATVARFDYVSADARTLTDSRGRPIRLWVKEEADGIARPDPQAFMDRLVKTIETILDREPIDVYASPTYLPEALAGDYDRLWTPKRMKRVVAALARNGVALEINGHLRLPGPALIKMAKEAEVKFALGTGNGDDKPGRLTYGLRMIEKCGLTPEDLWAPKPDGQKPIQVRKRK